MNAIETHHDESPIAADWAAIAGQAPQLVDTMARYLAQAGTFLAPASVDSASIGMRQLCRWLLADTDIRSVAGINRNAAPIARELARRERLEVRRKGRLT